MSSCREYESEIALEAGGDLEGEGRRRLESHLKLCSRCQTALERMKTCLAPLAVVAADESDIRDASVWQPVSKALQVRSADQGARQFNGWVAALATAALLFAAVGIAEQLPDVLGGSGDSVVAEGQYPFEGDQPQVTPLNVSDPVLPGSVPQDELESDDEDDSRGR